MSVPAKVLLQNLRMCAPGGFYRRGTKRHDKASADLRALAAAIIAIGC